MAIKKRNLLEQLIESAIIGEPVVSVIHNNPRYKFINKDIKNLDKEIETVTEFLEFGKKLRIEDKLQIAYYSLKSFSEYLLRSENYRRLSLSDILNREGPFTVKILSLYGKYIAILLPMYIIDLECQLSRKCINYCPTSSRIRNELKNYGFKDFHLSKGNLKLLMEYKFIKRCNDSSNPKYTLTNLGRIVSESISEQIYASIHGI